MSIFSVPSLEEQAWPTLGAKVVAWIQRNLVHGPGDLRGQRVRLDDEKKALIYRFYEVYPQGDPRAGRRRFRRCAVSLRKGSAKTELAAFIAAAELHPEAPVRCIGWTKDGKPKGGPVSDPYIPMVAYTEEQSEDLAYGALRVILELSPVAGAFDIGLERIMRKTGDGKAVALASAPDARDGARTTFQHLDETHRFVLPRLKQAHRTMLANLPKRRMADAWSLETTTAPAPGEGSVAEQTMDYAKAVADGRSDDARLFFFHREASAAHDTSTPEGLRAAVLEASGPIAEWSDIDGIIEQWRDPTADRSYLERVWLNRLVRSADRAFDFTIWQALAQPKHEVEDGALIVLGFDGSTREDATALIGTEVETGHQFVLGIWERPFGASGAGWRVPEEDVDDAVTSAFERFDVWRMYADPPYWETWIAKWAGQYSDDRVVRWFTNTPRKMSAAIKSYDNAMRDGHVSHDGNPDLARHIGNAHRRELNLRDEKGERCWVIYKERSDSPHKIDAAMAGVLSWEARRDALTLGAEKNGPSVYESRGLVTI